MINRNARGASGGAWEDEVRRVLAQRFQIETVYPATADEMSATVHARVADGALAVIAGGDGSFNAALRARADGPLAILPLGTANDLARALGLPLDPVRAAERIVHAPANRWDLLTVNGHPFCTVGGIGTAAAVVAGIKALRARKGIGAAVARRLGSRIYHLVAAQMIVMRRLVCEDVTIEITPPRGGSHEQVRCQSALILVANQPTVAGTLRVSPRSHTNDGFFELCIFRARDRVELLAALAKLLAGVPVDGIEVHTASAARLRVDRKMTFFGDGEILTEADTFEIAVAPGAITLVG